MPSLGLSYLNSALRNAGYSCRHLDHTFLERSEVVEEVLRERPAVVGIYCMITMQDEALALARALRGRVPLLITGGPPQERLQMGKSYAAVQGRIIEQRFYERTTLFLIEPHVLSSGTP